MILNTKFLIFVINRLYFILVLIQKRNYTNVKNTRMTKTIMRKEYAYMVFCYLRKFSFSSLAKLLWAAK